MQGFSHPQRDTICERLLTHLRGPFAKLTREQLYVCAEAMMRFGARGGAPPALPPPPYDDPQRLQQAFEAVCLLALADAEPRLGMDQVNLLVGDLVKQFEMLRRSEVSRSSARMAAMTGSQSTAAAASGAGRSVLDDRRKPSLRSTPDRLRHDTSSGSIPALPSPTTQLPATGSAGLPATATRQPAASPTQQLAPVQGTPTVRQSIPASAGGSSTRALQRPPTRALAGLPPRPTVPVQGISQPAPNAVQPLTVDGSGVTEGLGAVVLYDERAGAIEVLPMSQQSESKVGEALGAGRQLRLLLVPAPALGRTLEIRVEAPWLPQPAITFVRAGASSSNGTLLEVTTGTVAEPAAVPSGKPVESAPLQRLKTDPQRGNLGQTAAMRMAPSDPGRPRPATGSLLRSAEGEVADAGPLGTLMRQAGIYPGVVLELEAGSEHWRVTTLEDLLLDIEVSPMRLEFTLEALVAKSGLAEVGRLEEALSQHHRSGEPLESLLTTTGALRFRELDAILATRHRMLFAAFSAAPATRFRVQGYDRIEPLAFGQPISFATLAYGRLHEALEKLPPGELEEWARGTIGFPKPRRELRIPLQRFGIQSRELAFLETEANGATSLAALLSRSPVRRHATLALLATLDRMGYLEWVKHDVAELRAMRAKPLMEQKVAELQQGDLFGILDTHWSDYDGVIPTAAQKVIEGLDLPYLAEHGSAEMQQLARRLTIAVRGVADRLSTRSQREAVRAQLVDDFARLGAIDLYEKQADMALFKSDWEHAEDQLRRILELQPGNRRAAKRLDELLESRKAPPV